MTFTENYWYTHARIHIHTHTHTHTKHKASIFICNWYHLSVNFLMSLTTGWKMLEAAQKIKYVKQNTTNTEKISTIWVLLLLKSFMAFWVGTQTITMNHKTPIKVRTLYWAQSTHINLLTPAGIKSASQDTT